MATSLSSFPVTCLLCFLGCHHWDLASPNAEINDIYKDVLSFSPFFQCFMCLFERQSERESVREKERKMFHPVIPSGSLSEWPQGSTSGSQEFRSGLSCKWWGPKSLGCCPLLPLQELDQKQSRPNLKHSLDCQREPRNGSSDQGQGQNFLEGRRETPPSDGKGAPLS